jgi:hypothetical protein
VRGWELTLRSPRIAHRAQIHLAYSNQVAWAGGDISGGLTDFSSLEWGPLDHDQRNTLNVGADVTLPCRSIPPPTSTTVGFTSLAAPGNPTQRLFASTFDLTLGKDSARASPPPSALLNIANRRVLLTIASPSGASIGTIREIFVEVATVSFLTQRTLKLGPKRKARSRCHAPPLFARPHNR